MIATMIMKIAIALAVLATVSQCCRPGFTGVDNVCYSIANMKTTWEDAVTMCMAQGAYLADINSAAEQSLVAGLAAQIPDKTYGVWIGGTLKLSDSWQWIQSGLPFTYTNWFTGQPNNDAGGENCLEMMHNFQYKWNDAKCFTPRQFVCKYYEETSSNSSCCCGCQ